MKLININVGDKIEIGQSGKVVKIIHINGDDITLSNGKIVNHNNIHSY